MCIEYDRTPIDTDMYLSLCLRPLNVFFICWSRSRSTVEVGRGVRVGVGVGVTSIVE